MEVIEVYTIRELLQKSSIRGNKTRLSKILGISRITLRLYAKDLDCGKHFVRKIGDNYHFYSVTHGTRELR